MPLIGNPLGASVSVSELDAAAQARLPASLPVPVAQGGTGAASESAARTALGLAIGTNVQAQSSTLTTLASATAAGLALMDDATAAAQLTTLGVTTFAKTLLDDVDLAAAQATLGIGAAGTAAGVIVPSSGITAVTGYEISQAEGRLRLKARTDFPDVEANSEANPPPGMAWLNVSGNEISAATEGTSSQLRFTHGANTATRWDNSARTAPLCTRTYQPIAGQEWIAFIGGDLAANGQAVMFVISSTTLSDNDFIACLVNKDLGAWRLYWTSASVFIPVAISEAQAVAGVWFRLRRFGTAVYVQYSLQASTVAFDAVTWVDFSTTGAGTLFNDTGVPAYVGVGAGTGGSAILAAFAARCSHFVDVNAGIGASYRYGINGQGYNAAPAEQPLVVDFPVGADGVVSNANLQAWLASIVIEGSWTFSCVRGVGGHGSGAFAAAASATVEGGAGVALSIWAKATAAANTPPAALDLRRGGMLWTV